MQLSLPNSFRPEDNVHDQNGSVVLGHDNACLLKSSNTSFTGSPSRIGIDAESQSWR